jgi:hypothetical protein
MAGFAIGQGFGPQRRGPASTDVSGGHAPGPIQLQDRTPVLLENNDPLLEEKA